MLYARGIAFGLALATGCATATTPLEGSDAPPSNRPDARGGTTIDAPASPMIDAPAACTNMMTQLLVNPAFDATPAGMGWTATPISATTPIVTSDDGNSAVTEQTPTMKAWMGGYAQAAADDSLYQDVVVPASTTALALTGFYWIKSSDSTLLPYDTMKFTIEKAGTPISTVLSLDNKTRHTAWQPITHVIPVAGLSGQTIRVKIVTHNDTSFITSFWFDSLALTATHCQ